MVKKPLCDCVVLAMGYKPEASLADQLESEDLEVQKIADGVRMSNAFVANTEGFDSVEEERAIALSIFIKLKIYYVIYTSHFPVLRSIRLSSLSSALKSSPYAPAIV